MSHTDALTGDVESEITWHCMLIHDTCLALAHAPSTGEADDRAALGFVVFGLQCTRAYRWNIS